MPNLSREAFKKALNQAVVEYLDSSDVDEAIRSLQEAELDGADVTTQHLEWIKTCIYAALGVDDAKREAICSLLSSFQVRGFLYWDEIEDALMIIFSRIDDVRLDFPQAERELAAILAYLVQDDAITEDFLESMDEPATAGPLAMPLQLASLSLADAGAATGGAASSSASTSSASATSSGSAAVASPPRNALLAAIKTRALDSLHSRTPTPLAQLRTIYRELAAEYLAHGDYTLLTTQMGALGAWHMRPEIVRKVIQVSIDAQGDFTREAASDLLLRLYTSRALPRSAIEEGFLRTLRSTWEMAIDTPQAATLVGKFIARALADGVLRPAFLSSLPEWMTLRTHTEAAGSLLAPTTATGSSSSTSSSSSVALSASPSIPTAAPKLARASSLTSTASHRSAGGASGEGASAGGAMPAPMNRLARLTAHRSSDGLWVSEDSTTSGADHASAAGGSGASGPHSPGPVATTAGGSSSSPVSPALSSGSRSTGPLTRQPSTNTDYVEYLEHPAITYSNVTGTGTGAAVGGAGSSLASQAGAPTLTGPSGEPASEEEVWSRHITAAASKVIDVARSLVGMDPAALSHDQRARVRSVWGFSRPLALLRTEVGALVVSLAKMGAEAGADATATVAAGGGAASGSATATAATTTAASATTASASVRALDASLSAWLAAVSAFECGELYADLVCDVLQAAIVRPTEPAPAPITPAPKPATHAGGCAGCAMRLGRCAAATTTATATAPTRLPLIAPDLCAWALSQLAHRRIVRVAHLHRGIVQLVERLAQGRVSAIAADDSAHDGSAASSIAAAASGAGSSASSGFAASEAQLATISQALVALSGLGCLPRDFFIDRIPASLYETDEDEEEEGAAASGGLRGGALVTELRKLFEAGCGKA